MSKTKIKTACVLMTGPDDQMDRKGNSTEVANPLPAKCPHCTFPDIDHIPRPYLLTRGIASPAETSLAVQGNFLVRDRIRRILELVVPEACTFHPTADGKSKKSTPWWLAVPRQKLKIAVPNPKPPFCSKCGEAKSWDWDVPQVWKKMHQFNSSGVDVFKTLEWQASATAEERLQATNRYRESKGMAPLPWSQAGLTPPPHAERWTRKFARDLYFSVRLDQLFKRVKVKGQLVRYLGFADIKTSPADEAWVEEKLKLLAENGLVDAPKPAGGQSAGAVQKWFKKFQKKHAVKKLSKGDFAAVEKKYKVSLPKDYKDFISTIGPKSFPDVGDMEGSTTSLLVPRKLDFKNYRRGKVSELEGDDAAVDGVMFAATDHGDCFVFDISAKDSDYPVYWYRHEENTMEPFAPNFAECIKRFSEKN